MYMNNSKQLHFFAGLPRSGSSVLSAILNQNPETHVSITSGLIDVLGTLNSIWCQSGLLDVNDPTRKKLIKTMRSTIETFYDIPERTILDRNRNWPMPDVMDTMHQVLGRTPKIIATVRDVPDCVASLVRVVRPENLTEFLYSHISIKYLKSSYNFLEQGYVTFPECFLFINYEDLLANPEVELKRIHAFLELEDFKYDFNNIDSLTVQENDTAIHSIPGLHDIKPKLEKQHNEDSKEILGPHYDEYCQPVFWSDKKIKVEKKDLDLQLSATLKGDFEEAWKLAEKINQEEPDNLRGNFNRGWHLLRQGKFQEGYKLMDKGRLCGIFGNAAPAVSTPKWDGKSKGTVLLNLEGGLGDQIHQVRYAKNIADRGCKVIISCDKELAPLFVDVKGVSAIVEKTTERDVSFGVYHNFWVGGMSAVVPLGFELKDISGKPYINKPKKVKKNKKVIGLRWQGSNEFEDQHHKKFPYDLMFDAVKNIDAEFISLQRDEGEEDRPDWVKKVSLETWKDTKKAIASCDLVITSCTSVSHLAAAMGIDTWVVVPVMSYFLYAQEGEKNPYYKSMTLFRQKEYGNWEDPFKCIEERLKYNEKRLAA